MRRLRRCNLADYTPQCDIVDGVFRTGLWLPKKRPEVYESVQSAVNVMDAAALRRVAENPDRTPADIRFPGKVWTRSQGRRNSCAGYAAAGTLGRCRVASGLPFEMPSGEFIYSLCNGGRDQGAPTELTMEKIEDVGAAPESLVQRESYLWRSMSAAAREAAARFKGWNCFRCDTELEIATALANNFFVVAVVHASSAYRKLDARGVRGRSRGRGNHAIGLQDYRFSPTGQIEFFEVGSWGTDNGIDGYALVTWADHLETPNDRHAFYAISNAAGSLAA